jgi:hypothetical protein
MPKERNLDATGVNMASAAVKGPKSQGPSLPKRHSGLAPDGDTRAMSASALGLGVTLRPAARTFIGSSFRRASKPLCISR